MSRLGLGRLVPATSHLPAADAAKVEAISTLGDRPLAVLTSSENSTGTAESVRAIAEVVASVRSGGQLPAS